jgi:hypothetical protein
MVKWIDCYWKKSSPWCIQLYQNHNHHLKWTAYNLVVFGILMWFDSFLSRDVLFILDIRTTRVVNGCYLVSIQSLDMLFWKITTFPLEMHRFIVWIGISRSISSTFLLVKNILLLQHSFGCWQLLEMAVLKLETHKQHAIFNQRIDKCTCRIDYFRSLNLKGCIH